MSTYRGGLISRFILRVYMLDRNNLLRAKPLTILLCCFGENNMCPSIFPRIPKLLSPLNVHEMIPALRVGSGVEASIRWDKRHLAINS